MHYRFIGVVMRGFVLSLIFVSVTPVIPFCFFDYHEPLVFRAIIWNLSFMISFVSFNELREKRH